MILLKEEKCVYIKDLRFGMTAYEDIRAKTGMLLVPKGQEVTYPVIMKLRNFSGRVGVEEPFRVVMPEEEKEMKSGK